MSSSRYSQPLLLTPGGQMGVLHLRQPVYGLVVVLGPALVHDLLGPPPAGLDNPIGVRLDGRVRYPSNKASERIPLYRCDRVSHEVLVQEDVDLARWQIGRALAQVIQQPLAMLRPGLTGKLPYPHVGGEVRVRVEGGQGRFEGESSASKTFSKVPDPARQPDFPAIQREPTLSDQKRSFSITLLPQRLGHGESLLRCPQVLRGVLHGLIGPVELGEHDSVPRVLARGRREAQVLLVAARLSSTLRRAMISGWPKSSSKHASSGISPSRTVTSGG